MDVVAFMDVSLSSGLLKGERLLEFFRHNFVDLPLEAIEEGKRAVERVAHSLPGLDNQVS